MGGNQIIRMLGQMAMRALVTIGITRGIDWWARRGNKDRDPDRPMTAEERARAQTARKLARRARQAARITRRLGR